MRPYHPLLYRACKGYSEKLSRAHNVCYWLSPASERSPLILAPLPFHQVCRLHKASFVPDLSSRVYYVIVSSEGILTERTHHPWVQPWIHRRRLAKLLVPLLQLSGVTLIFPRGGRIYDACADFRVAGLHVHNVRVCFRMRRRHPVVSIMQTCPDRFMALLPTILLDQNQGYLDNPELHYSSGLSVNLITNSTLCTVIKEHVHSYMKSTVHVLSFHTSAKSQSQLLSPTLPHSLKTAQDLLILSHSRQSLVLSHQGAHISIKSL